MSGTNQVSASENTAMQIEPSTNEAYSRYAREQKREQESQGDGRKEERRILEELIQLLKLG